jgi:hypothetical protein
MTLDRLTLSTSAKSADSGVAERAVGVDDRMFFADAIGLLWAWSWCLARKPPRPVTSFEFGKAPEATRAITISNTGMSERSFSRHYAEAIGQTPARAIG